MITLFTLIGLIVTIFLIACVALAAGAGFIALFGDIIVCVLIIKLLIKMFKRKK